MHILEFGKQFSPILVKKKEKKKKISFIYKKNNIKWEKKSSQIIITNKNDKRMKTLNLTNEIIIKTNDIKMAIKSKKK